jgi:hypothetical protein
MWLAGVQLVNAGLRYGSPLSRNKARVVNHELIRVEILERTRATDDEDSAPEVQGRVKNCRHQGGNIVLHPRGWPGGEHDHVVLCRNTTHGLRIGRIGGERCETVRILSGTAF